MKKQSILLLVLFVCLAMPTLAQNKNKKVEDRIQLAREKYSEAMELINTSYEEGNYTTVVRNQVWPAIGPKTEKLEFFYTEVTDEEWSPNPSGYNLLMADRNYNVTVRNHHEEYLFDENGKPLFYFTHFCEVIDSDKYDFPIYGSYETGLPEFEVRLYYDENGKVIRSIYKMFDDNRMMKEITGSQVKIIDDLYFDVDFDYVKGIFDAIY